MAVYSITSSARSNMDCGMLMPKPDGQDWSFLEPLAWLEHAKASRPSSPKFWFRLSVVIGWRR